MRKRLRSEREDSLHQATCLERHVHCIQFQVGNLAPFHYSFTRKSTVTKPPKENTVHAM